MRVYDVICIVLIWSTCTFGFYVSWDGSDAAVNEIITYRNNCIKELRITDLNVIAEIVSTRLNMDDPGVDAFALCFLKALRVLNEDGTDNDDVSSYKIKADAQDLRRVSNICTPKSGSVDASEATRIYKCMKSNGIELMPRKYYTVVEFR